MQLTTCLSGTTRNETATAVLVSAVRTDRSPAHQALVVGGALTVRRRHEHLAVTAHAQLVHAWQLVLGAPLFRADDGILLANRLAATAIVPVHSRPCHVGRRRSLDRLQTLEEHLGRVDLYLQHDNRYIQINSYVIK